jgi:hypothetical protein
LDTSANARRCRQKSDACCQVTVLAGDEPPAPPGLGGFFSIGAFGWANLDGVGVVVTCGAAGPRGPDRVQMLVGGRTLQPQALTGVTHP